MQGSIRFFVGLLVVLGAVGSIETAPDSQLLGHVLLAGLGLLVMYSGSKAIQNT